MTEPGSRDLTANLVIGPTTSFAPGKVSISNGTIRNVERLREGEPEFDVLAPGFVDLQVNGIGTIDVATAEGDDWAALGNALLAQGVTTWCPTIVTAQIEEMLDSCVRVAAAMSERSKGLPEIAGAHLEGPFITVAGAHRPEFMRGAIDDETLDLLGPLKMITLAPELPGAIAAIERLSGTGVLVSIGHSACSSEQAHRAAHAGARLVTHLGNAMGPFHQRNPGLLGAALTDPRLWVSVIADMEHVDPELIDIAYLAKRSDRRNNGVVLVTDAVAAASGHVGPVEIQTGIPGEPAKLADGTLAGSTLTMDRAIENVFLHTAMSLEDAVRGATGLPASRLMMPDRGEIAAGRRADLVAMRRDPLTLETVWIAGDVAWKSSR